MRVGRSVRDDNKHKTALFAEDLTSLANRAFSFLGICGRFTGICGLFEGLYGRFAGICGRFKSFSGRFEGIYGRFADLCGRFEGFSGRFKGILGRFESFNGRLLFEKSLSREPHTSLRSPSGVALSCV